MRYCFFIYLCCILTLLGSCSASKFISRSAKQLTTTEGLKNAHVGILIHDVAKAKNIFSNQSDKYFVPASNTKIFTLYAAMSSLVDSIPGLRFRETAESFLIMPTADPTLLHPDFLSQPVITHLQKVKKPILLERKEKDSIAPFGTGWAWDDFNSSYMAERNALPVYGNTIRWIQSAQTHSQQELQGPVQTFVFSEPDVNWKLKFIEDTSTRSFLVNRRKDENYFEVYQGNETLRVQSVPFITYGVSSALELLKDTIHQAITETAFTNGANYSTIFSRPADSLFRPMMYNSDNFFAEQLLLMSSNERFGVMDEEKMITELLAGELKGLPHRPRWVDGSGLSRYNLFTPADFVWILNHMQERFGLDRLKFIFPGADQGTLEGYYTKYKGRIFAKTGTLSAHVALSGFLITKKNRLLTFSILVNNHQTGAPAVRRKIEAFLTGIIENY